MKYVEIKHPSHTNVTLTGWILDNDLSLGQWKERPAVVVCPGGGYLYLSPREGEPVALAYAAKGFHAFVLKYSLGHDAAGFTPLQEISWAIGLIREHAAEWHVAPDKIAACGFSAGGHLSLAAAVMGDVRPNAIVLGYPGVKFTGENDLMVRILTGKESVTEEDAEQFNLLKRVDKDTPPMFLFGTTQDVIAQNALELACRYEELKLPYALHLFPFGPHGLSLATPEAADGSSQVLNREFAEWLSFSVDWLLKIFGGLTFEDKSTSCIAKYIEEYDQTIETKKSLKGFEHA